MRSPIPSRVIGRSRKLCAPSINLPRRDYRFWAAAKSKEGLAILSSRFIDAAALRATGPSLYLVDPLEYFAARIASIPPRWFERDLLALHVKLHQFIDDADIPEAF